MTTRSILCLVMQAFGIFFFVKGFVMIIIFLLPFLTNLSFAGLEDNSFWFLSIAQGMVIVFCSLLLLFQCKRLAAVLIKEDVALPEGPLSTPSPLAQIWFWIAIIGLHNIVQPAGILLNRLVVNYPTGMQVNDYSAGSILSNRSTGPHLVLFLLSLALIVLCKPIGRLIQTKGGGDNLKKGIQ